jgi:hypothetical protein
MVAMAGVNSTTVSKLAMAPESCIVRFQFSIRTYMLAVVFVAEIISLAKLIPRAIRAYHP